MLGRDYPFIAVYQFFDATDPESNIIFTIYVSPYINFILLDKLIYLYINEIINLYKCKLYKNNNVINKRDIFKHYLINKTVEKSYFYPR